MANYDKQVHVQDGLVFQPHRMCQNKHFQTIGASLISGRRSYKFDNVAQRMLLEAEDGTLIEGFYSAQPKGESKGLILMIHGWLGNVKEGYMLSTGEYLYQAGYSIFRFHLRDHGGTCHLNQEPFRGDRLDELFSITSQIAQLEPDTPFYMVGFSLGGNFVLRLTWQHSQTPLSRLDHTIAFSPALDPHHNILALDSGLPLYLLYFRHKWRSVFREKEEAFPDAYDFSKEIAAKTALDMNESFAINHTPYESVRAYFDSYTVTTDMLANLNSPTTVIASTDDPMVPTLDLEPFIELNPCLNVYIQPYGGHTGFVHFFPLRFWMGSAVQRILEESHSDPK